MHLTLRQIHYFVTIVDRGAMAAAASTLHVAPTALSLQIKSMEENFGAKLLTRHSRGVRPTRAGTELYWRARDILGQVEAAERVIGPSRDICRPIRFGATPSALRVFGLDVHMAARALSSGSEISWFESYSRRLKRRLQDGALDLILASEVCTKGDLCKLDLLEEDLVFVTHPRMARPGGTITLKEALESELLFYREEGATWRTVQAACEKAELQLKQPRIVESVALIRQFVSEGHCAAIIPFGVVAQESQRQEIFVHRILGPRIFHTMSLAWRADDTTIDRTRELMSRIRRVVASHPFVKSSQVRALTWDRRLVDCGPLDASCR